MIWIPLVRRQNEIWTLLRDREAGFGHWAGFGEAAPLRTDVGMDVPEKFVTASEPLLRAVLGIAKLHLLL